MSAQPETQPLLGRENVIQRGRDLRSSLPSLTLILSSLPVYAALLSLLTMSGLSGPQW